MSWEVVTIAALVLWPLGELGLIVRERLRVRAVASERARATVVWAVAASAVGVGIVVRDLRIWPIPVDQVPLGVTGAALVLIGFALRLWAIWLLGRHFSLHVALLPNHQLVRAGPYRHVRHPAYAGLLLCFVGLGLTAGNVLSLLIIVVPTTAVLIHRIGVEERALVAALGEPYRDYQRASWRLLPLVY